MEIDFHVYVDAETVNIKMDAQDPQRSAVLDAVSAVMNEAGRSREADECIHAKGW